MAKDINGNEVKAANATKMIVVANQDAYKTADSFYIAIRSEIDEALAQSLREEVVSKVGGDIDSLENVFSSEGDGTITLLFTKEDIVKAITRAAKNPEDLPEARGFLENIGEWIKDLFD